MSLSVVIHCLCAEVSKSTLKPIKYVYLEIFSDVLSDSDANLLFDDAVYHM